MSVTEFLLARIAEDEALASAANVDRWGKVYEARSWMGFASDALNSLRDTHEAQDEYIYRFEPSRTLAECEAKRAILPYCFRSPAIVKHLAAVYADHPDYDPAWRP